MTARILHVSDLHVGRREEPEPTAAFRELARALDAELVVATGDLAHRGRLAELRRAAELTGTLAPSVLAVPGNHDIPYSFPARFTRTYRAWEETFGSTEPAYVSERLLVAGVSSVRPWRQQSGALSRDAVGRVAARLREAPAGALRVVALHHHLAAPPWRARRKRPLARRDAALRMLAAAGAELVLGGHVHQAAIAERREFEALEGGRLPALVLATAPGLGRPRPRRSGEARGLNVVEWDAETVAVATHVWDGSEFRESGRRTFARG